jgi:hypothetical protein
MSSVWNLYSHKVQKIKSLTVLSLLESRQYRNWELLFLNYKPTVLGGLFLCVLPPIRGGCFGFLRIFGTARLATFRPDFTLFWAIFSPDLPIQKSSKSAKTKATRLKF